MRAIILLIPALVPLAACGTARAETLDPANRLHCSAALNVYHELAVRQGREELRGQLGARIKYDLLQLKAEGGLTEQDREEGIRITRALSSDDAALKRAGDLIAQCVERQDKEAEFLPAMAQLLPGA